jgi:TonB family protein
MRNSLLTIGALVALGACTTGQAPRSDVLVPAGFIRTDGETFRWLATPAGRDLLDVYPPAAMQQGLQGYAVLDCVFLDTGRIGDCQVIQETPGGSGFGAAALRLVDRYRYDPVVHADLIGTRGRQTVRFLLG